LNGRLFFLKYDAAMLVKDMTGPRRRNPARQAIKKPGADVALQISDMPADGWL